MNSQRIEEIQKQTAYPYSISVQQALLQVWKECSEALKDEAAWLIEKEDPKNKGCVTGLCLGVCGKNTKWTTPSLAVRFARKEDALQMMDVLNLKGKAIPTEHSWSDCYDPCAKADEATKKLNERVDNLLK